MRQTGVYTCNNFNIFNEALRNLCLSYRRTIVSGCETCPQDIFTAEKMFYALLKNCNQISFTVIWDFYFFILNLLILAKLHRFNCSCHIFNFYFFIFSTVQKLLDSYFNLKISNCVPSLNFHWWCRQINNHFWAHHTLSMCSCPERAFPITARSVAGRGFGAKPLIYSFFIRKLHFREIFADSWDEHWKYWKVRFFLIVCTADCVHGWCSWLFGWFLPFCIPY